MVVERHPGHVGDLGPLAHVHQFTQRLGRGLHERRRAVEGAEQGQPENVQDNAADDVAALLVLLVERIPGVDINVHDHRFQDEQGGVDHHEQHRKRRHEVRYEILVGDHHYEQEQTAGERREAVAHADDLGDLVRQAFELEVRLGKHDHVCEHAANQAVDHREDDSGRLVMLHRGERDGHDGAEDGTHHCRGLDVHQLMEIVQEADHERAERAAIEAVKNAMMDAADDFTGDADDHADQNPEKDIG